MLLANWLRSLTNRKVRSRRQSSGSRTSASTVPRYLESLEDRVLLCADDPTDPNDPYGPSTGDPYGPTDPYGPDPSYGATVTFDGMTPDNVEGGVLNFTIEVCGYGGSAQFELLSPVSGRAADWQDFDSGSSNGTDESFSGFYTTYSFSQSQSFSIPTRDDNVFEGGVGTFEHAIIRVTDDNSTFDISVTIEDNDLPPNLTFHRVDEFGNEYADNIVPEIEEVARFNVKSDIPTEIPTDVIYSTADGTAVGDSWIDFEFDPTRHDADFELFSGRTASLNVWGEYYFDPDMAIGSIEVPINDDEWHESFEDFSILLQADNANVPASLTVTIDDDHDDTPVVTVPYSTSVIEDNNDPTTGSWQFQMPITLSNPSLFPVAVPFATLDWPLKWTATDVEDYVATSGLVTIPASSIGNLNLSGTGEITIVNDTLWFDLQGNRQEWAPEEHFYFDIGQPTGGRLTQSDDFYEPDFYGGPLWDDVHGRSRVTIVDERSHPSPTISGAPTQIAEGGTATISLSYPDYGFEEPRTLRYTAYVTVTSEHLGECGPLFDAYLQPLTSGLLNFTPGNGASNPTDFTVTAPAANGLRDLGNSILVDFEWVHDEPLSQADDFYQDPDPIGWLIVDDRDTPTVSVTIAPGTIDEGESAIGTVTFSHGWSVPRSVTLARDASSVAGANDFGISVPNSQFPSGQDSTIYMPIGATQQTFEFRAYTDTRVEADEPYAVRATANWGYTAFANGLIVDIPTNVDPPWADLDVTFGTFRIPAEVEVGATVGTIFVRASESFSLDLVATHNNLPVTSPFAISNRGSIKQVDSPNPNGESYTESVYAVDIIYNGLPIAVDDSFLLDVTATNSFGFKNAVSQVDVTELAGQASPFFLSQQPLTLIEGAGEKAYVGIVAAADPDLDDLQYQIEETDGVVPLVIDSKTGVITSTNDFVASAGTTFTFDIVAIDRPDGHPLQHAVRQTISLTVEAFDRVTDRPPATVRDVVHTTVATSTQIDVTANDADFEQGLQNLTIIDGPIYGTATIITNAAGRQVVSFTSAADAPRGYETITYAVDDDSGNSAIGVLTIGVDVTADSNGRLLIQNGGAWPFNAYQIETVTSTAFGIQTSMQEGLKRLVNRGFSWDSVLTVNSTLAEAADVVARDVHGMGDLIQYVTVGDGSLDVDFGVSGQRLVAPPDSQGQQTTVAGRRNLNGSSGAVYIGEMGSVFPDGTQPPYWDLQLLQDSPNNSIEEFFAIATLSTTNFYCGNVDTYHYEYPNGATAVVEDHKAVFLAGIDTISHLSDAAYQNGQVFDDYIDWLMWSDSSSNWTNPAHRDHLEIIPAYAEDGDSVGSVPAGSYTFVDGNQTIFQYDTATGEISVEDASQLVPGARYELHFTVDETSNDVDTATVTVLVNWPNRAPVFDTPNNPYLVVENSLPGTFAAQVSATDPDLNTTFHYEIVAGNTGANWTGDAFQIDATTGVISVASTQAMDFETTPTFSLIVTATDDDSSAPLSDSTTVVINLVDQVIELDGSGLGPISENTSAQTFSPTGLVIGDIVAQDWTPVGSINFTLLQIVDGNGFPRPTSAFSISTVNQNLGRLAVADESILDYEVIGATHAFDILVQASDSNSPPNTGETWVRVQLLDENDPPTNLALTPSGLGIAEDTATTLRTQVTSVTFLDDALGSESITLSGSDAQYFHLDGQNIYLNAGITLDWETKPLYTLSIEVDDATVGASPDLSTTFDLAILDVNEAPSIDVTVTLATIVENLDTAQPTQLATYVVTDDSLGTNIVSLTGDDASFVEFVQTGSNPQSGIIYLKAGVDVDREASPGSFLDFVVEVDDAAIGASPDDAWTVQIVVNDENDNPPTILPNQIVDIPEDAAALSSYGTIDYDDPDIISNGYNWYISATGTVTGNDGNDYPTTAFSFISDSLHRGRVVVIDPSILDFESGVTEFTITGLVVNDGIHESVPQTFTINVIDVNDEPPVIETGQTIHILESSANGTAHPIINATDVDGGGTYTWSIVSDILGNDGSTNNGLFDLESTGILTTNVVVMGILDRDVIPDAHTFDVQIVDISTGLTDTETVTVILDDVNDTAPIVPFQTFTVAENSANGTDVAPGPVNVIDPDLIGTHTFQLYDGLDPDDPDDVPRDWFQIDTVTGQISVLNNTWLDFETLSPNPITVYIKVADGISESAWSTVDIQITDVVEPVLLTVRTDSPTGTIVADDTGVVDVGRPQLGTTFRQTFVVTNHGNDPATVNAVTFTPDNVQSTGKYTFIINLNGQVLAGGESASFEVDLNTTTEGTFSGELSFTNTDPDNNPYNFVITAEVIDNVPPVIDDQSFDVDENEPLDTLVGNILATDANGDDLTFEILAGNDGSTFKTLDLPPAAAQLLIDNNFLLNHELAPVFVLEVRVTDPDGESDTASITVNVNDVEEQPEAFDFDADISELAPIGSVLGFVNARDEDVGDTLTYTITGGNINNLFEIDNATGAISVTGSLYDRVGTETLTISITDSVTQVVTITATIGIADADDKLPDFVQFEATDYEISHSGELKFSPLSGFSYANGQDIVLRVEHPMAPGQYFGPGETISLLYGQLTVNDDFTLTYTPASDLKTRQFNGLSPELDANNNIYRFSADEASVEVAAVLMGATGGLAGATALAAAPVAMTVTNSLPVLRGSRLHNVMGLEAIDVNEVFVAFNTTVRIDVEDLFEDPDGDPISIIALREGVNNDLDELQIKLGEERSGAQRFRSRFLLVETITDTQIDLHNELNADHVTRNGWQEEGGGAGTFGIRLTDGQFNSMANMDHEWELVITPDGQRTDDVNWAPPHHSTTWTTTVSPPLYTGSGDGNDGSVIDTTRVHRTRLGETPPNVIDDTTRVNGWQIQSSAASPTLTNTSYESVGGTTVDLRSGAIQVSHPILFDASGGNSELGLTGLVYDSSMAANMQPDGQQRQPGPVIQTQINNIDPSLPLPTRIVATLHWHDHIDDANAQMGRIKTTTTTFDVPDGETRRDFVISVRPDDAPIVPGIFGWDLELQLEFSNGVAPIVVATNGQTVVNSDQTFGTGHIPAPNDHQRKPLFGNGWSLAGVPSLSLETFADDTTLNDRALITFPGQAPRIFDVEFNNSQNVTILKSRQLGTSLTEPAEFGTLTATANGPNQPAHTYSYRDGNGVEYHFKSTIISNHNPNDLSSTREGFLLDRIEQPSLDFDPATPGTGRRGVSFIRDQSNPTSPNSPAGRLTSIVATDGSATVFNYGADGFLDSIAEQATGLRQVNFDINATTGELLEIRNVNQPNADPDFSSLAFTDSVRKFEYIDGLLTVDEMFDGSSTTASRHREYEYDHDDDDPGVPNSRMVSRITIGSGTDPIVYQIQPSGLAGLYEEEDGNRLIGSPDDLKATITLAASDLERIDEQASPPTPAAAGGTWKTEYTYSFDGHLEQRKEFFETTTDSTPLSAEEWTYDHVGSVKTYNDSLRTARHPEGRTTQFKYDYDLVATYTGTDPGDVGEDDSTPKYDPDDYRGNIVQILAPNGRTTFEYETDDERNEAVGRLMQTVDPRKTTTIYTRFDDGRTESLRTTREDATDYFEQWEYYTSGTHDGYLQQHISPLGLTTTYTDYDNGRVRIMTVADNGVSGLAGTAEARTTVYTYDTLGLTSISLRAGGSESDPEISKTDFVNDAVGRLRRTRTLAPGNSTVLASSKYDYDAAGATVGVLDGNGVRSNFVYDDRGLLTRTIQAVGATHENHYLSNAELDVSLTTAYTYYSDGSLKETNQLGHAANEPITVTVTNYRDPTANTNGASTPKTWTATDNLAGNSTINQDGTVNINTDLVNITSVTTDAVGRVTNKKSLLTGTQTTYKYEDERHDLPTTITETYVPKFDATITQLESTSIRRYDAGGLPIFQGVIGSAPTRYDYDELGYLKTSEMTVAVNGSKFVNQTDPLGNVTSVTEYRDFKGAAQPQQYVTTMQRDEQGRVRRTLDAENAEPNTQPATITYGFDLTRNESSIVAKDRNGIETSQYFDAVNQMVEEINGLGGKTEFGYDSNGNLTDTTFTPGSNDTLPGRKTSYSYDELNRLRKTEVGTANTITTYVDFFDASDTTPGWDIVTTDANGNATAKLVDSVGNPILVAQPDPGTDGEGNNPDSDAPMTLYSYVYGVGTIATTTILAPGSGSSNADPQMVVSSTVVQGESKQQRTQRLITDSSGRLLQSQIGYSGAFVNGVWATQQFDVREWRIYDAQGRMTDSFQGATTGSPTKYEFDDFATGTGKANLIKQPNQEVAKFEFDSAGNTLVQSGSGTSDKKWSYDGLARPTSEGIDIDWVDTAGDEIVLNVDRVWTYKGLTTDYRDRNDQLITTVFDPSARTMTESSTDSDGTLFTSTTTLHSDGSTRSINEKYTVLGGSVVSDVTTTFALDEHGRPVTEDQALAFFGYVAPASTIKTLFTDSGDLQQIERYLNGQIAPVTVTTYSRDNLNRVNSITDDPQSGQAAWWSGDSVAADKFATFTYNTDGQISGYKRYQAGAANIRAWAVNTYYETGEPKIARHNVFGQLSSVAYYEYTMDADNRLKEKTTTLRSGANRFFDERVEYTYDQVGQIATAKTVNQIDGTSPGTQAFGYSRGNEISRGTVIGRDNRLMKEDIPSGDRRFTYDKEGRLTEKREFQSFVGSSGVGGPPSGFTVTDTENYKWDHRGRLTEVFSSHVVTTISGGPSFISSQSSQRLNYYYDGLNRQVGKVITNYSLASGESQSQISQAGESYVYDPNGRSMELRLNSTAGDGDITRHYFVGPGPAGILSVDQTDGTTANATTYTIWYFSDAGGTSAAMGRHLPNESWQMYLRDFGPRGSVQQAEGEGIHSSLDAAPVFYRGMMMDDHSELYTSGTSAVDPATGRYISQAALGDPNPYRFAGNKPHERSAVNSPDGPNPFDGWGSASFGFADSIAFGHFEDVLGVAFNAEGTQALAAQNGSYYVGMGVGIAAQIAAGNWAAGALRVGTAGRTALIAAKAYTAYAVVGDVVGVYDSLSAAANGSFTPLHLLGFAPALGWASGLSRGAGRAGAGARGLAQVDNAATASSTAAQNASRQLPVLNPHFDVSDNLVRNVEGGRACFVAGTPILLPDDKVQHKDIAVVTSTTDYEKQADSTSLWLIAAAGGMVASRLIKPDKQQHKRRKRKRLDWPFVGTLPDDQLDLSKVDFDSVCEELMMGGTRS